MFFLFFFVSLLVTAPQSVSFRRVITRVESGVQELSQHLGSCSPSCNQDSSKGHVVKWYSGFRALCYSALEVEKVGKELVE